MSDDPVLDEFELALQRIQDTHKKKKADYSAKNNRWSNFELASQLSGVEVYKTFEVLIGIKQARLVELMQPGRVAYNEPIEDTLLDRAVYSILAYAHFLKEIKK
jgi:hypothetical protein